MRFFSLLALGALALGACQTAERAADTTADAAETAAEAVEDAAGSVYRSAADVFDEDGAPYAVALVRPTTAPSAMAQGTARFRESDGGVVLGLSLSGLQPGPHAVHVHQNAQCGPGADGTPGGAAGGHWDPLDTMEHGAPSDDVEEKHLGDFGNFEVAQDGTADVVVTSGPFPTGDYSVAGHAVIIHQGRDDLETDPAGDAGTRVGCGVIEPRNP